MKDKIIDIEITLAHHEQQITEMSDLITDQWKMIEILKRRLDKALAKIDQISESGEEKAVSGIEFARQNTPPHF
ncbi:MAG: SlyX family protein [Alphaproteobacteria bacterium]